MNLATAAAVYFLIWWITLFAVLPWGVRSQQEAGDRVPGTDPGAPTAPMLGRKMIWTTVVASALFCAFYAAVAMGLVTFAGLPTLITPH